MKSIFRASAVSVSVFLGAICANAADLGTKKPGIAAPIMTQFNWTGFYAGAHAGISHHHTGWVNAGGVAFAPFSTNGTGVLGGYQLGYRHQIGQFVLGIETDGSISSLNAKDLCSGIAGSTCRSRSDWAGSVRARVGYAFDRIHIYATGGYAFANYRYSWSALAVASWQRYVRSGWTIGAGVEYAVTDRWTLGVEHRYTDFGSSVYTSTSGTFHAHFRDTSHQATARVTYKF